MFPTFEDKNATLMKKLAASIKAAPLTGSHNEFFDLPEVNIQSLDNERLLTELAGGQPGAAELNDRFKESVRAAFPALSNMPRPVASANPFDISVGGMYWPPEKSGKASGGGALRKSYTDILMDTLYSRALAKGIDLAKLPDPVRASLREMAKEGKIKLVEEPGRTSISVA